MTATRKLDIVVNGKDEASSKLKKMSESIQSGLKKVAVAAGIMGAAFVAGIKSAVDAYQTQERAEARLEQLTRQTTNATNEQIQALKDQASALQEVGVIGDEVTMFGQSQLATFGLQTDAIAELTPAMLDLVVSQKGVNATQEDMINAGNMIGKVMDGQVGALSRVGVSFTEAQAEILKTGTEMEKASVLAEILNQNFGGLNETMAGTSEGQIAQLKNSFGDLMEQIGGAVIPVIIELVEKIKPVIENMMAWIHDNQETTLGIIKWTGAILAVLVVLPMLVTGIGAVGTALMFLTTNPIGMVITAIGGLVTIIVLLITHWDEVKAKVLEVWETIKNYISEKIAAIKEAIGGFIENIRERMSEFMDNIREAVANGMEAVKQAWSEAWANIFAAADVIMNKVKSAVEWLTEKIKNAISKLKDLASEAAKGAASVITMQAAAPSGSSKRASGGNVFPGNVVRVGEQGPEDVVFGQSGRVIPNSRIGGGGVNLQVVVSNNTVLGSSIGEFAEMINNAMIDKLRLQTKLA